MIPSLTAIFCLKNVQRDATRQAFAVHQPTQLRIIKVKHKIRAWRCGEMIPCLPAIGCTIDDLRKAVIWIWINAQPGMIRIKEERTERSYCSIQFNFFPNLSTIGDMKEMMNIIIVGPNPTLIHYIKHPQASNMLLRLVGSFFRHEGYSCRFCCRGCRRDKSSCKYRFYFCHNRWS